MEEKKKCKQCEEEKLLSEFYVDYIRKDGELIYRNKCKECICHNNKELRVLKPKKSSKKNLKCEFCDNVGYNNKQSGKVLCARHLSQYKRHGKILENTRFETNDYIISECDKYAIINLRDRQSNKVGETIVDIEDLELALQNRLHLKVSHKNKENPLYYAIHKSENKNIRLHNLIMGAKNVDHINNDGLDNRKSNLRIVTNSQNGMNQRLQARSKSGVTGVNWGKSNHTWHANIKKDGKTIRLSCGQSTFDNAVKQEF